MLTSRFLSRTVTRPIAPKFAVLAVMVLLFSAVLFTTSVRSENSGLDMLEANLTDLIYQISQSVVTVESSQMQQSQSKHGNQGEALYRLVSSGLVYDTLGHIVVAASSVVGREPITVSFEDQLLSARIVAVDYQTGVAVIKVPVRIGTPIGLSPNIGCAGQMTVAMGNSHGLRASPSLGFCAGLRTDGQLQFTSTITSGSVGGGLFDLSGNLTGMIVGALFDGQNFQAGLAVPSHSLQKAVENLLATGDCTAGYIGLTTVEIEITPGIDIAQPSRPVGDRKVPGLLIHQGLVITEVVPNSPASRAGLAKGDLIYEVSGIRVAEALQLRSMILRTAPDSRINVGLIRGHRPYTVPVTVGILAVHSMPVIPASARISTPESVSSDSLMQEIQLLKKALLKLESRVRRSR